MANLQIDLQLSIDKANANLIRLEKEAINANKRFVKLEKSVDGVGNSLKVIGGLAVGVGLFALAKGAIALGESTLTAAGKIETLQTQFEVLTQSAGKAKELMEELTEFTAKTPFRLDSVGKAASRLISFGFEVDSIGDKLQVLGDVAAASGADLGELALIFGQVKGAGRLTGERLLQLQERAIPIGPALAKSMGIAESAVRKMVSSGKVDFASFEKAFNSLNDTGEFAFGGMVKRSRTLEGRISTLQDNMALLSSDVGKELLPAFKGLITTATIVADKIRNSAAVMEFFGDVANSIPGIISSIASTLTTFNNIIQESRKFINILRFGFNTLAVTALDVIDTMVNAGIAAQEFIGMDTTNLKSIKSSLGGIRDSFEEVAVESLEANDKITESQASINKAISEGATFVIKSITDEIDAANKQAEEKVISDKKIIDSSKMLTAEQLKDIEERRKAQEKLNEQLNVARLLTQQQKEAVRLFDSESELVFQDERLIQLEEFFTREQEATLQANINLAQTETEKQIIIEGIVAKGLQGRLKQKQEFHDAEKKLEKTKTRDTLQATSSLFGALAGASALGGKKLFGITKAFSTAEALISGHLAVQKALASAPPPINYIAAAAVGIRAATNVARINSASPPGFEDGGFIGGRSFSGDNLNIGVNSGEAVLNSKQQRNFMKLAEGQSGSGPKEIVIRNVIELDGTAITESVSRHVADGFELGEIV